MIDDDCITFQTSSSEKMSSAQVKIRIKQYGYGYNIRSLFSSGHKLGEWSRVYIRNKIIRRVGFIKTRGMTMLGGTLASMVAHEITVH